MKNFAEKNEAGKAINSKIKSLKFRQKCKIAGKIKFDNQFKEKQPTREKSF